jgi:hypothetical protein
MFRTIAQGVPNVSWDAAWFRKFGCKSLQISILRRMNAGELSSGKHAAASFAANV